MIIGGCLILCLQALRDKFRAAGQSSHGPLKKFVRKFVKCFQFTMFSNKVKQKMVMTIFACPTFRDVKDVEGM